MARKKQFKLNKESEHDLEIIKYFEPYFDLSLLKIRIMGLLGAKNLREQMTDASEEDWKELYRLYKGDK